MQERVRLFDWIIIGVPTRGKRLMAIHLILLSANKIHGNLVGSVEVVSDCLGAL